MRAVTIHETGGPDVLQLDDVDLEEPGEGQIRVRVEAAGLNFIDTYHRNGAYPLQLPTPLGLEAAGVVDAVGSGVARFAHGDRVAYTGQLGAYAEYQLVPADAAVVVPEGIGARLAAAAMLQGMTAHYLTRSTFPLSEGDTALVHAAAGGVGHLLTQMCKLVGARVVATCGSQQKAELVRRLGADEVVDYTGDDFVAAVERFTDGRGVDVVYDGVGRATFRDGLGCLRPRGTMVLYGQASGAVEPFDPQELNARGSIYLTRPSLGHHIAERSELEARAEDLFGWIGSGELEVRIDTTFPLDEAGQAHRYLEGRNTKGKVLLLP